MKTIVVGIGNPILRDDGVGIHVVNEVRRHVTDPHIVFDTTATGGLNLLDILRGYDKAILVDAVQQDYGKVGDVRRFSLSEVTTIHSGNPHDVSLSEALLLTKKLGDDHLPTEIIGIGVVVKKTRVFGDRLSRHVKQAIPAAVQMVLSELKNELGRNAI